MPARFARAQSPTGPAGASPARSSGSRTARTRRRSCSSRRTDQDTPGAKGVSAFVLDAEHVRVTRDEEKLGLNSSCTNDIAIEGATVGRDRLLHEEGKGFKVAMATLDGGTDRDRGAGGRHRAGGVRRRARVREGAAHLRQGDRGAPGDPVQARRHGDGDRRSPPARLPRCVAEAAGPPAHRGGRQGQALRLRDGAPPDRRGDPDPRRATGTRRSFRSSATTATRRSPRSTKARARSSAW